MSDLPTVQQWLAERRITEIECLTPDMSGQARGKIVPRHRYDPEAGLRRHRRVMRAAQTPSHSSQSHSSTLLASYTPSPSLSRSILLCVADCGATSITPRLPATLSWPSCG